MSIIDLRLAWAARLAALTPRPDSRCLILAAASEPSALAAVHALAPLAIEWPDSPLKQAADVAYDVVVLGQGVAGGAPTGIGPDEAARWLGPGGVCGVATYLAPEAEKAADYVNAWLALRGPAQTPWLSLDAWERELFAAGLLLTEHATASEALDFDAWIDGSPPVTGLNRWRLRAMLRQAPEAVQAHLTPIQRGDRIIFHLQAGFLISQRPVGS